MFLLCCDWLISLPCCGAPRSLASRGLVRTFPSWLWLVEIFLDLRWLVHTYVSYLAVIGWNLCYALEHIDLRSIHFLLGSDWLKSSLCCGVPRSQVIGPHIFNFALIGWTHHYAVERLDLWWLVHTCSTLLWLVELITMLWGAWIFGHISCWLHWTVISQYF